MKLPKRLLASLCLLAVTSVQGQDLLTVFDLALQQDPALREARQQLESVRESRPQALSLLLPSLSLGGSAGYTDRDIVRGSNEGREDFSDYGLSLRLQQPVFRRDLWLQLDQSDNQIAQAEATYARAELDLMARVINVYFSILAAQDDLTVSIAQTEANSRQLEQARQRFDVGLIAITDVHEAQAAYDSSRADQISSENKVDDAWEALYEIVGPYPKEIATLGEELPLTPPEPANIDEWANSAVQQNYAVIAAMNTAEFQRKQIEVTRSGHYPTVDLQARYGIDRTNADLGSDVNAREIGLELNVPLYQGGGVTSRVRQAQYDYEAAREALDRERRSVNADIRNAYRGVISSISRVYALKATMVSSKSALDSTQAGYEVGTRTLVDVLTVQSQMFDATRNYLSSRYQYIINAALLKQRASILSREDIVGINGWLDQ
ncbi:MAG: TolC family outer membrane protein [Gammaproteobacteria bacterium]|nr:TolC family outer membrane protein [Gammaproteobacteria bacterium]